MKGTEQIPERYHSSRGKIQAGQVVSSGTSGSHTPRAAYIHVPFCAHKCGYCDFASLAGSDHLADRYLVALEREMAMRLSEPRPVDTIFIGGGTPTRLDASQLARLLSAVAHWFPLDAGGEWTVEANPGTLDESKVEVLHRGGVNRVSLGAQSFHRPSLKVLERNHDPEDVPKAVDWVRSAFDRWSLDLIFGVPGSTLEHWSNDLEQALALGPDHLSCYGLTFEKGTLLWKQQADGAVHAIDEDVEYAQFAYALDRLASAGLRQYEISNHARPGQECRHNLVYWSNAPYFGVGLGAARFVDRVRAINTRDLMAYLKRVEAGDDPTGPSEQLETDEFARETLMLMLRRTQLGVNRQEFQERTGVSLESVAGESLGRHIQRGNLEDDGQKVWLTRQGIFVADMVLADML